MVPVVYRNELRLVADVIKGDSAAVSRFIDLAATQVWSVVVALVGDGAVGEKAFLTVIAAIRANGFARLLRYDGRSRLSTFFTCLSRDVLGEELARSFSLEPNKAWQSFERFFAADFRRLINRKFPRATETRSEDLYQEVCLALVDRDYYRIRAFGGRGSFSGYILSTVVANLLTDLLRQEAPRRRLPADIARMSPVHQAIFVACAWDGVALDAERIAMAIRGKIQPEPRPEEVAAAFHQLAGKIAAARGSLVKPEDVSIDDGGFDVASPSPTPEEILLEQEEQRAWDALLDVVRRESGALPGADRLYFEISSQSTLPPREIAKLMAIPVEEVYSLKQRMERWVKQIASGLKNTAAVSV
jgi:RNA polymerase primary sigma factor